MSKEKPEQDKPTSEWSRAVRSGRYDRDQPVAFLLFYGAPVLLLLVVAVVSVVLRCKVSG